MKETLKSYVEASKRASYHFILAGILLIMYESLMFFLYRGQPGHIDNGAGVWIKGLLSIFPNGTLWVSLVVLLLGIFFIIRDHKEGIKLKLNNLIYLWIESLLWAMVIFFNLGLIVHHVFGPIIYQVGGTIQTSLSENLVLSLGAGFYEELFFRVMLVKFLHFTLLILGRDPKSTWNTVFIIMVTATLFSLAHFKFFLGGTGDDFSWHALIFRLLFGIVMSILYIFRGFGIAAWTHAIYDVLVYLSRG